MKKSSYPWLQQQPAPCCIFPAIEYFVPHHSQDPNKENTVTHCRPKIIFLCILFNGLQYFCFQRSTFKADPSLNWNTSLKRENDLLGLLLFKTCLTFFCGTKRKEMLSMSELLLFQPKLCSSKTTGESYELSGWNVIFSIGLSLRRKQQRFGTKKGVNDVWVIFMGFLLSYDIGMSL